MRRWAAAAPRAVPEVVRLGVHSVRRWDDLDEVAACHLDGGDLGRRKTDEVRENAADDGGVSYDEQVLLLALELDQSGLETDCRVDGGVMSQISSDVGRRCRETYRIDRGNSRHGVRDTRTGRSRSAPTRPGSTCALGRGSDRPIRLD